MFRLTVANWDAVMGERPVIDLWGVGPKVSKRLLALGIRTVAELAAAPEEDLTAEFGPRMGLWYRELGQGGRSAVVDDTPWVPRGHSRETTYQADLADPEEIERAALALLDQVLDDVAEDGRGVIGLGLKVRYAPFTTKTFTKRIPETAERAVIVERARELIARIAPDRAVRLLGVRAEMTLPEDARDGRTPTRGAW